ncbi:MFS general substrate transporter [Coprinopsis sp. MPI-PUGE-AT-0042]|nr:MFS general substrate transporter [Coprinopsis sp. MPI-PUGE-AT-0042]
MQVDYKLDYVVVSLLFVATAIGHIVGAAANIWLNDRFGFGKVLVFGACVQTVGYVIMCPTPPFPAFAFASGLTGFGISLANGQANGFLGSLKKNMHTKLGIYHGCYGLGAFLAPFVSTVFSTQPRWTFHYLTSAGMQLTNIAALILVFKFRRQEEILADAGQNPSEDAALNANDNKFKSMIKQPAVHLLAAFCLIYVGIEVSLGGWIVTFIIRERSGGPSSGYISSGFFGGLALGRVALIGVNRWIGEERVVYVYTILAIGQVLTFPLTSPALHIRLSLHSLELTIWFVPSIIQMPSPYVSIIGLLLGPFFPIIVSHSSRILPHWMLTACVGWIAGIGVSGSACLASLQPLMVSMMGGMVLMWLCVPKVNRKD